MFSQYIIFAITSFLLIIVPGPDTAVTTRNTLVYGKEAGVQTVLGTCLAITIHTTAAALGLSAIIMKSAIVFSVFKYIGAAYLIYMGVKAFKSLRDHKIQPNDTVKQILPHNHRSLIGQGFYTNILNPKVAVFFLTFFPQFITSDTNVFVSFFTLGLLYIVIKFTWFVTYIYVIDFVRNWMQRPRVQAAMDAVTGIIFVAFGIKLAFEKSN
ncbi:LysE family translocator [Ureibacillus sp. NPDC094379]